MAKPIPLVGAIAIDVQGCHRTNAGGHVLEYTALLERFL